MPALRPKKFVIEALGSFAKITYEVMNEVFHEYVEKEVIQAGKDLSEVLTKAPESPESLMKHVMSVLEKRGVKKGGIPLLAMAASVIPAILYPFMNTIMQPFVRGLQYEVNKRIRSALPGPEVLVEALRRKAISEDDFSGVMACWGFSDDHISTYKKLSETLPSEDFLDEAYLRKEIDEEKWVESLLRLGYSKETIELRKKLIWRIPPLGDIITMAVREVFEPDRRKELLSIPPAEDYLKYAEMRGLDRYWAENYWAAHWRLPPVGHLNEFLYRVNAGDIPRDQFNEEVWKRYIRYHDYEPKMIPLYEKIIYRPYTRVDTRRMYADGVLTKEEVMKEYLRLGYDEEHARNLTLWTIAYEETRKVRDWLRKGWIDTEGAKQYLISIGVPKERVEEWIKRYVKNPERTAKERDLTKSEIVKGVKKGIISVQQGIELLKNLGYEEWEAKYILAIHLIEKKGDPDTYIEMLKTTLLAKGPIPSDLEALLDQAHKVEERIHKLKKEIEEKRKFKQPETEIAPLIGELGAAEAEYRKLLQQIEELRRKYGI